MPRQYTSHLLMIRPARFQFNEETAISNAFQRSLEGMTEADIREKAIAEFDGYVEKLRSNGIIVTVIQDSEFPAKPDAIFPNNWISMHEDGTVFLYPMNSMNRRLERRDDIVDVLDEHFEVNEVHDLSGSEADNKFLEGTGSIIFDHINQVAYACLSPRTDKALFIAHCEHLKYEPVFFTSSDSQGNLVYHTNVMLTIGDRFAVICLESIRNEPERNVVSSKLKSTGHEIVDISEKQMNAFAGNMLQVSNTSGQTFLVMSETAYKSLKPEQVARIEIYTKILPVSIPTIETIGGGSARCMLAEIFLPEKI
jgi:hypothetical protein